MWEALCILNAIVMNRTYFKFQGTYSEAKDINVLTTSVILGQKEQVWQSKSNQERDFTEELAPWIEEGVGFPWARRGWTVFHAEVA